MINKKITLKELAVILKVSVSTVSKALNDSYEISEATKKKVKTAAIKYNYSPNLLAQGLKTKKTKILGVVIPDMRAPFSIRVLRGIEKEASEQGYNILTCFSDEIRANHPGIDFLVRQALLESEFLNDLIIKYENRKEDKNGT